MSEKPVIILIADDDPMDRLLIEEAFAEGGLAHPLYFVEDGEQLMHYLRRRPPYDEEARYPFPGILLLDLNMPKMDGHSCLKAIRKDSGLRHLPVVIFSTSSQRSEIHMAYDQGANSFMTKALDFDQLVAQLRRFDQYWCSAAELPTHA